MSLMYSYLNYGEHEGRLALEMWPDKAGVNPGGTFDYEAWEKGKGIMELPLGLPAREAMRDALRALRGMAKFYGGLELVCVNNYDHPARFPDYKKPKKNATGSVLFCSFCGKGDEEVSLMIQGAHVPIPGREDFASVAPPARLTVCICDDYIQICRGVIAEHKRDPGHNYDQKKGGTAGTGPARNHQANP